MNNLRLIKFAVVIMTSLLVLGLFMLLTVLFRQVNKPKIETTGNNIVSLQQPKGSRIEQMLVNDGRLHILLKDGGKDDRIIVLSPNNQNIQQEIVLDGGESIK